MKHEKLVRDLIPQLIEENGDQAITRVLDDEEYFQALKDKLLEEVQEYAESEDHEELADILEVIRALVDFHSTTYEDLEKLREQKMEDHGAFESRVFLVETIENS